METKRDRRRRDLLRMKAKAKRVYPHDQKAKLAEHLKVCSCWMCGNPRRNAKASEKVTIQERRSDLDQSAARLVEIAPPEQ